MPMSTSSRMVKSVHAAARANAMRNSPAAEWRARPRPQISADEPKKYCCTETHEPAHQRERAVLPCFHGKQRHRGEGERDGPRQALAERAFAEAEKVESPGKAVAGRQQHRRESDHGAQTAEHVSQRQIHVASGVNAVARQAGSRPLQAIIAVGAFRAGARPIESGNIIELCPHPLTHFPSRGARPCL